MPPVAAVHSGGMARRLRVALLIESSREYGRGLLRGIAEYARTHGGWSIHHHERSLPDAPPPWLRGWRGDGIIVRAESPAVVRLVRRLKLPAVDLRALHPIPGVPAMNTDDAQVSRLAADHLRDRGFRNFGYCGFAGANYSDVRRQAFADHLAGKGLTVWIYADRKPTGHPSTTAIEARGLTDERSIARWVRSLPKPVGIMACNDVRARQVLNACRDQSVAVPEQVAVIGVDNDPTICELSDPPLSSIEPDTRRIGYEAARVLENMIHGRAAPVSTTVPPLGVVERQSTDVAAIDDAYVAAAVHFIRRHAHEPMDVADVVQRVGVSRRSLERRFAAALGRPPHEEILRVRLDRVRQLLRETRYPLAEVARLAGFRHAEYMSAMFRNNTGETPGAYRRKVQRSLAEPHR